MIDNGQGPPPIPVRQGFSGLHVLGIIAASIAIAVIVTTLTLRFFLFPPPFKPVVLSAKEEQKLSHKIAFFQGETTTPAQTSPKVQQDPEKSTAPLKPERYSEEGLSREIIFTERELNAMVAKNTDLADKLAIDLAEDLISVKLLIPLDPDFPVLGGQTFKVKTGVELNYKGNKPLIRLKGVSLMGVPMPNSWLGGLKNVDLIEEFSTEPGFWKSFSEGIDSIHIADGQLKINLKE